MGAKTALVAFADGDLRPALRAMGPPRRFRPGPDATLAEVTP
ncbi:hypothetical protein O7600_17715 [Micromonospora sp. WMMA1998]|nr:hypothetical protein [Micromonospora sp. WMMA1998]WBC13002.1 hypothetical protein O7600_17715 [Micromonospora sp. WMMA1998]